MKVFSHILLDLYESASHTGPKQFAEELIRLLHRTITFDGAVYGVGLADPDVKGNLIIERAYVYEHEESLLNDYLALSARDPIIKAIATGLQSPVSCTPPRYYKQLELPELEQFAVQYRIKNLLVYGHPPTPEHSGRWVALFRDTNLPFKRADTLFLELLWPHLSRAIRINLFYTLHNTDPQQTDRASGLINTTLPSKGVGFLDMAFWRDIHEFRNSCGNRLACRSPRMARTLSGSF